MARPAERRQVAKVFHFLPYVLVGAVMHGQFLIDVANPAAVAVPLFHQLAD